MQSLSHGPDGQNVRLGVAVGMLVAFWSAYDLFGARVGKMARDIGEQIVEYVEN